jgi:hypothetical protein
VGPNGVKQGSDYENVAVCTNDPNWRLGSWDELTPDLLPGTHLARADQLLVRRGARPTDPGWERDDSSYGDWDVYSRARDWTDGTPPSGSEVMREVTDHPGIYPDVIFCTQGLRTARERADIPFRVAPRYQGLWAEEAQPLGEYEQLPKAPPPPGATGRPIEIGVVDTGVAQGQYLNPYLEPMVPERWRFGSESDDPPDLDGNGRIESPAGHGTFVGGAVAQIEPNVRLHIIRAVGRQGAVSDSVLADRIGALMDAVRAMGVELDILNLSLGAWTHDDYQPLLTGDRLARLPSRTLVVAAAGNLDSQRKFWPAAMERVVAVGAMIRDGDTWARAEYSNYGDWVDAIAWDGGTRVPGKRSTGSQLSTFYTGFPAGAAKPEFSGWAHWRGTSFTAPKVVGRIAQVMTRDKLMTAEEAWQRVREESRGEERLPDFPNAAFVTDAAPVRPDAKPKPRKRPNGPLTD